MERFKNDSNAFNFSFEKMLEPESEIILKMPPVSPNKRGINDIGFTAEEGITLYATISAKPYSNDTIWQEIQPFDEINKTTAYIKIKNTSENNARVNIRVILN